MSEAHVHWFKASYSAGQGTDCVEVATLPGGRAGVRDSKDREGGMLTFGAEAWRAFTEYVDKGSLA